MKNKVYSLQGINPGGFFLKLLALLRFTLLKRSYIALIILTAILLLDYSGSQITVLWWNFLDEIEKNNTGTIFNLVSLLFIVAIWLNNIYADWQNTLPKYLSVKFYCKDNADHIEKLADEYALLISETDIRSLAQQIGRQKNSGQQLDLDSTKYQFTKTLSFSNGLNHNLPYNGSFWHYEVDIHLRTPPTEGEGKQYLSQEEYFEIIKNNLNSLQEKTAIDYETDFIAETKKLLEFKLAEKFSTRKKI